MTQLYALQKDLDMLTQEVRTMKDSYDLLDKIAGVVNDLYIEFKVLSEQMKRLEERLTKVEERLTKVEERLTKVEQHLGISPA